MVSFDNPAGRMREVIRGLEGANGGTMLYGLLMTSLDVPDERPDVLYERLALIAALPAEISEAVKAAQLPVSDMYLTVEPELRSFVVLLRNLDRQVNEVRPKIGPTVVQMLEVISALLDDRGHPEPTHSDLVALLADLNLLLDEVLTAPMAEQLRNFLVSRIRQMCDAIQDAQYGGPAPFVEATFATAGELASFEELRDELERAELGARIWEVLGRAMTCAGAFRIAYGVVQVLTHGAIHALPPG